MSRRAKVWAKVARVKLLTELGPFCHWPGCRVTRLSKLTFDHIHGKDYDSTGLSTDQRMLRYRKEAAQGELQVLCAYHNEVKGNPQGLTWRQRWFEEAILKPAYGERLEA